MKNLFIIIFAQIIFVIIGLLITFFEKKTCLSRSCKELSNAIKQNLDTTVNPCDDFYRFTCGKVVNGSGSKSRGMLEDTMNAQFLRVFRLLKEDLKPGEPEAYAKAKKILKKCSEDNASEDEKLRKVRELFQEVGGFPIFEGDSWKEAEWTWLGATGKLRARGLFCDSLFSMSSTPNPYDHNTIFEISDPVFPVFEACTTNLNECNTLFNDTFFTALLEFGVSKEQAEISAVQIYDLEKQLFELSKSYLSIKTTKLDKDFGRNLANMTDSFDFIDWPKLVGIMMQKDYIPNSFKVLVSNPGYMTHLKAIFQNTSRKLMANYMMWKVLQSNIVAYSLYPGKKTESACFSFVVNTMGFVMTPLYLEKYPDPRGSDLELIVEMVDLLKNDFLAAIKNADWMSEQVKEKSALKIKLLRQRIGDLKVLNKSFVEELFRGLSVEGNAFEAMLSALKFAKDKMFESCSEWSATFSVLAGINEYNPNAFYLGVDNSFNVLHGILQKPVYDPRWPGSINFGRIGSIVGHEITHSLDEEGHHYDEHGDLKDTWDSETYEKFNKTSQCLADQFDVFYNSSPLRSPKFSGSYKSVENMADTGGSKLAFLAYRKYTDSMFWPDFLLPNLDYSSNQLFFISFALFWCSKADTSEFVSDTHSPSEYRVLKTLRNNPYFAQVFDCRLGYEMTYGTKCDVW